MEKSEALKRATPYLQHKDKVHVTSDGQVFFDANKSDANYHSRANKLEVFTFSKADLPADEKKEKKDKEPKK